jgi:hypothetical protein
MEKQADDYYAAMGEAAKESHSEKVASLSSTTNELDGLVAPTEEEMGTLRHVSDKIDWTAYCRLFSPSIMPSLICL